MFTVERGVDRLLLPSGETLEMEVQHEIFAIEDLSSFGRKMPLKNCIGMGKRLFLINSTMLIRLTHANA